MANQKYYSDTGSQRVWVPQVASIWHVRDNEILHDYADTRSSVLDYGTGLQQALGATGPTSLTAGDKIIVGPGKFDLSTITTCTISDIELIFNGTILELTEASTVNAALQFQGDNVRIVGFHGRVGSAVTDMVRWLWIQGDDCLVENSTIDGGSVTNAGAGIGFLSDGDRTTFRNCVGRNMLGAAGNGGRAFTLSGQDCLLDSCEATNNQYAGLRASNMERLMITNTTFLNNGNRDIEFDGSTATSGEYIKMSDCRFLSNSNYDALSFTSKLASVNVNLGYYIDTMQFDNCIFADLDTLGAGVSWNVDNRVQQLKTQRCRSVYINNCEFRHGTNSGTPSDRWAIAFDAPVVDTVRIQQSLFSGGIQFGTAQYEYLNVEDCEFGLDSGARMGVLFDNVPAGRVRFARNEFNLGTNDATRIFDFTTQTPRSQDYFELIDCIGSADNTANVTGFDDDIPPRLIQHARRVVSANNIFTNSGTGSFLRSADDDTYLMLHTDRNGDMLYYPSDGNMPAPGAGPNFFTSVPGITGQKIINAEWSG